MAKPVKTVEEKLATKLAHITDEKLTVTAKQVKVGKILLFKYTPEKISYTRYRYFPSMKEEIVEEDFTATILLSHQSLGTLSSTIHNPPRQSKRVLEMFRHIIPTLDDIVIGSFENKIVGNSVHLTLPLYNTLVSINREESRDKVTRVRNRVAPFLRDSFALEIEDAETVRDYSLLLNEVIASKQFSQSDIVSLTDQLETGENNEVVITQQITKQAAWLIDSMQEIIDHESLSTTQARELGKRLFGIPKTQISGPENLMEKILAKYGQNIIFGVPALLNTKKYVIAANGLSKSQFDLILINHLSDIEIVELKRTDEYLLEYDSHRGKFYMSSTLSVATAQAERYISALYRENDLDFKIDGKTIREFISSQIEGTITLSICRPKALIVIGAIQRLAKPYSKLPEKTKNKVTNKDYEKNLEQAYQEIKASFKNIDILTYSELIEGARLRLQTQADADN